ncbi:MAG: DHH family phosphoesterase [Synergistaceae bacterium]|nr:DHH family phosphoesterase [Synergistaceae bacterium]
MIHRNFNAENLFRASEILKAHDTWVIFTHKKADGDAVGSATAVFEMGINAGKKVSWFSPDEKLPDAYSYLPHFGEHVTQENFDFVDDGKTLYVFVDCANETRGVSGFDVSRNINAVNIDHHEDNTLFGRVNCVDGSASSTCEMLYRVFTAGNSQKSGCVNSVDNSASSTCETFGNWPITLKIAESLYTGLYTDTGGFNFSNTTPLSHNIAAELIKLGVKPDYMNDLIIQNKTPAGLLLWARAFERLRVFGPDNIFAISIIDADDLRETGADMTLTCGLSGFFMSLRGVKLFAMIAENLQGEVRLSFRSREGSPICAGEIARTLGGGGHERAAGSPFYAKPEDAMNELEALIMKKYHELSCADK